MPQDCPPGKVNYWGYAPVSFFAPHQAYSSRRDPLGPVDEFRDMVKALHRAGIEVILDVVFNHTAEGDERGPTLCFRGLDNTAYYILEDDRARYANYTGTGNTLNANHPIVRRMIVDSLRYWVEAMHVDGFRFDLASILARDAVGSAACRTRRSCGTSSRIRRSRAPSSLPRRGTRRVSIRSAASSATAGRSGTAGSATTFATSSAASRVRWRGSRTGWWAVPRSTGTRKREAEQSVNFVTCHDGFTLNDLVSYDRKHNEANGEDNRDGANDNRSWNCGVEGPTDDPEIERLRNRQVKNFLTVTLLSLGMPMILMGDEARRTQSGNNNAYCQDNEISWFDWTLVEKHADVHRFVTLLNARRLLRDVEHERRRVTLNQLIRQASKTWHGVKARAAGLGRPFPQPRFRGGAPAGGAPRVPDPERVLGAAGIRAAAGGRRRRRLVAPMDRYRARIAAGHRPVADGALAVRPYLSGGGALRRGAVRRDRARESSQLDQSDLNPMQNRSGRRSYA